MDRLYTSEECGPPPLKLVPEDNAGDSRLVPYHSKHETGSRNRISSGFSFDIDRSGFSDAAQTRSGFPSSCSLDSRPYSGLTPDDTLGCMAYTVSPLPTSLRCLNDEKQYQTMKTAVLLLREHVQVILQTQYIVTEDFLTPWHRIDDINTDDLEDLVLEFPHIRPLIMYHPKCLPEVRQREELLLSEYALLVREWKKYCRQVRVAKYSNFALPGNWNVWWKWMGLTKQITWDQTARGIPIPRFVTGVQLI